MSSTVTLGLPDDAIISQAYDSNGYPTNFDLTVNKTDIPFFVRFLLGGLSDAEKSQVPLDSKEKMAKAAGLKYVYRLPSILRTVAIGTACGIAIKALADNMSQRQSIARAIGSAGKYIGYPMAIPPIFGKIATSIQTSPYAVSMAMAGSAFITTQTPKEVASLVSYTLEGGLSFVKAAGNVAISGCKKAVSLTKDYLNFWKNNPKTGTVVTASVGLGITLWMNPNKAESLYGGALKIEKRFLDFFKR